MPFVIVLVGNRQRALGNLLHDAGHRNLARSRLLNDGIACAFLGPPLFNSLVLYRKTHARHHAWLGNPQLDPDFISLATDFQSSWWTSYLHCLCSTANWAGSIAGHLRTSNATLLQKLAIVLWWAVLFGVFSCCINPRFAILFLGIWLFAKMTVFHAITTFREMCDHFGLRPGGIFSFTRDVPASGLLPRAIHPRNNGYHLTHHLMPSVPYYRLPKAHEAIEKLPSYLNRATTCDAYFKGSRAVVAGWINPRTEGSVHG